jgi:hypothetical protein
VYNGEQEFRPLPSGGPRLPTLLTAHIARPSSSHCKFLRGLRTDWLKVKNSDAPAVKREAEEDWGR